MWKRDKKVLKRYEAVLLAMVALSLPYTAVEYFALRWRAWAYYPDQVLSVRIGAQLETYIYAAIVTLVVAAATLIYASRIDNLTKPRRQKRSTTTSKKIRAPKHTRKRKIQIARGVN